jgi:hypothetical protein
MSARPSSPAFSSPTPDTGTGVPRLEAWLKADAQSLFNGLQALTIASGAITPADGTTGSIVMDTESAAATDTLDTIAQTNMPDGYAVLLQIADNGRVITINHNAGGTGQITLNGGIDFEMNRTEQRLLLQRSGTSWVEVARFGREKEHGIGDAGEPAMQNSWTELAGGVRFWRDESGVVRCAGYAQKASVAAATSVIFTLPAGYRPSTNSVQQPCSADVGGTLEANHITVGTNGEVTWQRATAPSTVTVTVSLAAVHFRAEA